MKKNVKHVALNLSIVTFLNTETFRCFCCNKIYQHKVYTQNNNNFILLLQKGIDPYKYMDDWEIFIETSLSEKDFYSHLDMEDISDADYAHSKRVCRDFEIKS